MRLGRGGMLKNRYLNQFRVIQVFLRFPVITTIISMINNAALVTPNWISIEISVLTNTRIASDEPT